MTTLAETERRPGHGFSASYSEDGRFLRLHSETGDIQKQAQVYNVRNQNDHEAIAKAIASGDPGAFDVGIIGILIAVEDPRGEVLLRREQKKLERLKSIGELVTNDARFWQIKEGRPETAKVPFMATPRVIPRFVDFDKLHPDFRHLRNREAREELYQYPIHIIWPANENPAIHNGAFVTTADDSREKPKDQHVEFDTVCIFTPGSDEDWKLVGERAARYNPHALFGVTSFNSHGEQPPFNHEELPDYIANKANRIAQEEGRGPLVEFDFLVIDPVAKDSRVHSSHTQVRLPLVGEEPTIKVVRRGPVGAEDIMSYTSYQVEVLESATLASREASEETDLFPNIQSWMEGAAESLRGR